MNAVSTNQTPFDIWKNGHSAFKAEYLSHKSSFLKNLLPELAVNLNAFEIFEILEGRLGPDLLRSALNPDNKLNSPVHNHTNTDWLKKAKMVGVNVRTIGNFFNLVKYLLTIGSNQDSIHILPIWEPGVVSSLYGKTSWNINQEFFSQELYNIIPTLNTVEKQLIVVINIIHAMGKTVGLDVIPHTDRFSELVFLNPKMFEWIHRKNAEILSIQSSNAEAVEDVIWNYLEANGSADGSNMAYGKEMFFDYKNPLLSQDQKLNVLFGSVNDPQKRLDRRLILMQQLLYAGFETLPVTMAPPYRGLKLDANDYIVDKFANKWYNYKFIKPEKMSRVFGPLTRYKFYETLHNQDLDFNNPMIDTWDYVCKMYYKCQQEFNFDFMRGDMAHVQARSEGVPAILPSFYDPLKEIKNYIQKKGVPYFGFFAETFIAPPDTMGYGDEIDHLEAIDADTTLGDLQATPVGSEVFMTAFYKYIEIANAKSFKPSFTIITADKDDPRFDSFYFKANHLRYFMATFFNAMPSYMSLGFECRNLHLERGKNEEYTKLYVFQIDDEAETDKVTQGPFVWGENYNQFLEIQKIKCLYESLEIFIDNSDLSILSASYDKEFIWKIGDYLFVVNLNPLSSLSYKNQESELIYSSIDYLSEHECRVYKY